MSADGLLSRLNKVRKTGPNSWVACCPAHDDKSPSLSIRDADDGRILCHCFAGCSIDNILLAVGMSIDDLFPARLAYNHGSMRRSFPAADVLETIARETMIVATAACNIRKGIALSDADHERLLVASERIFEARRLANGS
jgi:CHC2 zinc finger